MAVNDKMPGIFITPPEAYDRSTRHSEHSHARPAFIRNEYGYAEPAVGLFTGKIFLSILQIEDAERLIEEIKFSIGEHPGQEPYAA